MEGFDLGPCRDLLHQGHQRARCERIVRPDGPGSLEGVVFRRVVEGGEEEIVVGREGTALAPQPVEAGQDQRAGTLPDRLGTAGARSEEHTSELQSLMRNSYAGLC